MYYSLVAAIPRSRSPLLPQYLIPRAPRGPNFGAGRESSAEISIPNLAPILAPDSGLQTLPLPYPVQCRGQYIWRMSPQEICAMQLITSPFSHRSGRPGKFCSVSLQTGHSKAPRGCPVLPVSPWLYALPRDPGPLTRQMPSLHPSRQTRPATHPCFVRIRGWHPLPARVPKTKVSDHLPLIHQIHAMTGCAGTDPVPPGLVPDIAFSVRR